MIGLVLATLPAAAMAQAVRLRSEVRVSADEVRLGDVAAVTALPAMARQVVVLTLSDAQPTGRIDLSQLQLALRRCGVNPVPVRFSGAARCRVRRAVSASPAAMQPAAKPVETKPVATEVTPTEPPRTHEPAVTIGDRIRRQVISELGVAADEVQLTFKRSSSEIVTQPVDDGAVLLSTDRRRLGRRLWRVEYTLEGRPYRRYIPGSVSIRRRVVAAVRTLAVGETIGAADVQMKDYADDGAADMMVDPALVVGQQVKRAIAAGAAVSAKSLISPLLVQRGQEVWVQCGPVRLAVRALANGRRGERIRVENLQSKGRFLAVVTGPAQAAVAPAGSPAHGRVTR